MSHQLHNSLVRILTADGIPVGVGFLAAENLIPTCAHVIAQAGVLSVVFGDIEGGGETFLIVFDSFSQPISQIKQSEIDVPYQFLYNINTARVII